MSGFSRYVQVCHCGHDKDTHYECEHTCLGMQCDCQKYIDRDDEDDPKARAPVKKVPFRSMFLDDDIPFPTPRVPTSPLPAPFITPLLPTPVQPHPLSCMCAVCVQFRGAP